MIDVNEEGLDAERGSHPPQRRGQRERIAATGKPDNDALPALKLLSASANQKTLLESVRGRANPGRAIPGADVDALGAVVICLSFRGVHSVPTGGIEPPAEGL